MPQAYTYTARDRAGKPIVGTIEGESETHVVESLRRMGYVVSNVAVQKEAVKLEAYFERFQRVKGRDLALFTRQFATMINSGLSLTRCLSILSDQTESPALGRTIKTVLQDVEGGSSLSEALEKHPKVFS
ncbi:MAG: type II secretion system F family protein, partial [Actinomycetota bacterium]